MPANLTPAYRAAEAAFRKARDPSQRLEWLREMLRVIRSTRRRIISKATSSGA
jgi:hypothetical protein